MASSLQLEISSNVELANIAAVVRLATEAAPTKAEAEASPGYVSLTIPPDATRKFSISQHYTTNFTDGLTIADVLTPNTAYKLYLYFPTGRITTTAELTGLSITNDRAVVPFTTAILPAEGDAKWLNSNGSKCVESLDSLYFMQEQTGVVICYYYTNHTPLISVFSAQDSVDTSTLHNIGRYDGGMAAAAAAFHFGYGSISGYTSNASNRYTYWIGADKVTSLQTVIRLAITDGIGRTTSLSIPVTRY
ncbi:hypothetical protein P0082_09685 [Candidatus Haliotispira prima]|uniref:Uncharacterized protein n=1 Tax=Candidatus Haliotispira prima TaxID=3034016 RepID=A0ABY8MFN9_9SPIO|nr:hypothetical protein P0082_09685 [Candidatus Haliotispira prima]